MRVLESYYPAPPDTNFEAHGKTYEYDLRLEVGVGDEAEEIALHDVFVEFLKNLTGAADHPIAIHDVHDNLVTPETVPEGEEFKKNYSVEQVPTKNRKILVGFKLQSVTPMSVLKHRMFGYLREKNLFLRIHVGGYLHGLRHTLLGYIRYENPSTADLQEWKDTISRELQDAWKHNTLVPDDIRKQILQKFPRQATKTKLSFPITVSKERVSATNEQGKKVETTALVVTTPNAYGNPVKRVLDEVLLKNKSIPAFIPAALRREDPEMFYDLLNKQARFILHHRNIQLVEIAPAKFNKDLRSVLQKHPNIQKIYLDAANSISTIIPSAIGSTNSYLS